MSPRRDQSVMHIRWDPRSRMAVAHHKRIKVPSHVQVPGMKERLPRPKLGACIRISWRRILVSWTDETVFIGKALNFDCMYVWHNRRVHHDS